MPFSFARAPLPVTLRVCRSLVWTQAMFVVLAGVFLVLTSVLFGSDNSVPFGGALLTGSGAVVLGVVYIAAGIALAYLGGALGRRAAWSRNVVVGVEVVLGVLLAVRSLDLSISTALNVALLVAIVALLFAPASSAALVPSPGTGATPSA